jgi:hypothetical protein
MKKILCATAICLALSAAPAYSHHPAEDMVDPEVYAMIDALVADTPHADLVFDDDGMGLATTEIEIDYVSDAEDMIDDGLLADVSLLDGDTTVTIEFLDEAPDDESISLMSSVEEPIADQTANKKSSRAGSQTGDSWTDGDDWGRKVIITIIQDYSVE